jgi:hypothetical protein
VPGAVCREAARLGIERGTGFYPFYPLHPCSIFLFAQTIFNGIGKAAIDVPRRRRRLAGMERIKGIKATAAE